MKVRILGNSIRFRLKQTEVRLFKETGKISEVTELGVLPGDRLEFVLAVSNADSFKVKKCNACITIEVPEHIAVQWTTTEEVGFEAQVPIGMGSAKKLKILVEKDFACLDGTDRDNQDAYPNPSLHC